MDPFLPGEAVTRVDVDDAAGRIVSVSADGRTVEVRWAHRAGRQDVHEVTVEPADALRRLHESEDGVL